MEYFSLQCQWRWAPVEVAGRPMGGEGKIVEETGERLTYRRIGEGARGRSP
jgi:hypothetical protein